MGPKKTSPQALLAKSLIIGLAVTLCLGCTRKTDGPSKVSFSLPMPSALSSQKVGAMSGSSDQSFYVAINVTGPSVNLFCSYDAHDNIQTGPCVFNMPQVSLTIPSQNDVLFQVMYAIDASDGSTELNYAEDRKNLTGGDVPVSLTLKNIGVGATAQAHISGRYLGGTVASPISQTGLVKMKYLPAGGSPAMTIMQSEMFAGWMKIFAIENVKMLYEVDGAPLFPAFSSGLNYQDFVALVDVATPANAVNDAGKVLRENETDEWLISGFFGPGADSAVYSTLISAGACSGNHYSTCLEITPQGVSRFNGPFQPNSAGAFFTLSSNWNFDYLPGVTATDLDGVKLYKLSGISDHNDLKSYAAGDGLWNCEKIKQNGVLLQSLNFPANSFTSPALAATDVLFACPFKAERMYTAAVGYPEYVNSFGRGGYRGPYLRMHISGGPSFDEFKLNELATGVCYQSTIGLFDNGQSKTNSTGSAVTIDLTQTGSAAITYYSDSNCSSATTTASLPAGTSVTGNLYFKSAAEGAGTIRYKSIIAPGQDFEVSSMKPRLRVVGPTKLADGECVGFQVHQEYQQSGTPLKQPSGSNLNLTFNTPTNLAFYSNEPYCQGTPITATQINAANSSTYGLFVKKLNSTPEAIDFSANHSSTHVSLPLSISSRSGSHLFEKAVIEILDVAPYYIGRCYTAKITLVNAAGEPVPTKTYTEVSLQNSLGDFYYDDCTSGWVVRSATISAGETSRLLRFSPNLAGTLSFSGASSSSSRLIASIGTSPVSIAIGSAPSGQAYLRVSSAPTFSSKVIGSHEFGASRSVLLDFPTGAKVDCSQSADGTTWSPCASSSINTASKTFNWTSTDAALGKIFSFQARVDGGPTARLTFDPKLYYGIGTSAPFQVVDCAALVPASGSVVNSTELTAALAASHRVCVKQGASLDLSGAQVSISSTSGNVKSLIGWAGPADGSQRTQVTTPFSSGSSFSIFTNNTAPVATTHLANLKIPATASFAAVSPNSSAPSGSAAIRLINLHLVAPASGSFALMYVYDNNSSTQISLEDSIFELNDAFIGLKILNNSVAGNSSPVNVRNLKIINPNASSNVTAFQSIAGASGTNSLSVDGLEMLTPGHVLQSNDSSASGDSALTFRNCHIDIDGALGSAPFAFASNKAYFWMTDCRVQTANTGRPLFSFANTGVLAGGLTVKNNIFTKNEGASVFEFTAGSSISNFNLTGNHFVKVSSAGGGHVLNNSGSAGIGFTDNSGTLPPNGSLGNRICHTSSATPFGVSVVSLTAPFTLSVSALASPLLANGGCP